MAQGLIRASANTGLRGGLSSVCDLAQAEDTRSAEKNGLPKRISASRLTADVARSTHRTARDAVPG